MVEGEIAYLPDSEEFKFIFTVDMNKLDADEKYTLSKMIGQGRGYIEHDADFEYVAKLVTKHSRGQGRMPEP